MKKFVAAASSLLAVHECFAHPGHAPGDVVAQISHPLSGPDHLLAFLAAGALAIVIVQTLTQVRARRRAFRENLQNRGH